MSLISYHELRELINAGVIDAPVEHINGASVDITLGETILLEKVSFRLPSVDLQSKASLQLRRYVIPSRGFRLMPGQFALVNSSEVFNLPNDIAAEYKLKSSLARCGLQHLLAGWCDPGWNNSTLTLEIKNVTEQHVLLLKPGMKIGQMVFWRCDSVPNDKSYAARGQYNDQGEATPSKGLR